MLKPAHGRLLLRSSCLMTSEACAASIRTNTVMVCLGFSRAIYGEIFSGSGVLFDTDIDANMDWSRDHETRSLFKHIKTDASPKITVSASCMRLTTAFPLELSANEVMSRMVITVKIALKVDSCRTVCVVRGPQVRIIQWASFVQAGHSINTIMRDPLPIELAFHEEKHPEQGKLDAMAAAAAGARPSGKESRQLKFGCVLQPRHGIPQIRLWLWLWLWLWV